MEGHYVIAMLMIDTICSATSNKSCDVICRSLNALMQVLIMRSAATLLVSERFKTGKQLYSSSS